MADSLQDPTAVTVIDPERTLAPRTMTAGMQPIADIGIVVAFITGATAGYRPDHARPIRKMLPNV